MKIIEATGSETEAAKQAMNVVTLSREEYAAGVAKIREEERREIAQRSTYVDEKSGAVRHFQLSQPALEAIHQATAEKLAAFDMRFGEEEGRRIEAILRAAGARLKASFERFFIEPLRQELYILEQQRQWQERSEDQGRSVAIAAVAQRRDLQLAQREASDAASVQDKIDLENRKTAIEAQAIKERARLEMQQIDAQTERQIDEARKAAAAQGISDEEFAARIAPRIAAIGEQHKQALQNAAASQVDVGEIKTAAATRRLVDDYYRGIFDSLKSQVGEVFDALVTKSESVWKAIGNSLKNALLKAIKDVVTSEVTTALMRMFVPGAAANMQQQGGGGAGLVSGLRQAFGMGPAPVLGAAGAGGAGIGGLATVRK